jgi:5-methyltetrahydrofolate--homocysteine methyltransferase
MEKQPFFASYDSSAVLSALNNRKILIFDGAIGTALARRGLETSPAINLSHPDDVLEIHRGYAAAGVDALTTNTFAANRIYTQSHGISLDLQEANLAAVRLAREAAGNKQHVFGNLGPTGCLLQPYGEYSERQIYESYLEQATILAGGGVDGFIIETMTDLREALCALKACKAASDLPALVTLSFFTAEKGGRTVMGNQVSEIAVALEEQGADALGANCGELTPEEMARIAHFYRQHTSLPVMIQPNAGRPKLKGSLTVYDMTAEEFAGGIMQCVKQGAQIVGGCCGTTPEHLRAVIALLRA